MTDAANNNIENNFSFQMFDLYRRFVELLQLNPDFLIEFKSGYPKEEVCRDMIRRIFQHRQKEEKIAHLLKYLNRNAKTIANHAENIPNNWTDAIKYTDQCIKLIKKYFRTNGIDVKTDFNVDEVTEGVGELLHDIPNKVQLQAIRDYLIHDLRNPKRNIIPQRSSKKNQYKSNKSSEEPKNLNANDSIEIAMEVIFNESSQIENTDDYQNLLRQKSDEIEKLLQENNAKSQNELLHIADDTKSSLEESVQSVIKVEVDSSFEDEDIDVEIESPEYERLETVSGNITDVDYELPNTCKGLKRPSIGHSDHEHIKKMCTQKDYCQNEHSMDEHQPVNYSKNDEFPETEKLRTSTSDSSESQSIVENVKANVSPINSKEDLLKILEDVNIKTMEEIGPLNFDKQTLKITENCSSNNDVNFLNPLSMTYHDAYKLMESIMGFCALKNETSIEEFLILRRTRDKMLWRSLKQTKKENQSKN